MDTHMAMNRLTISRQDFGKCGEFLDALAAEQYGTVQYEALLLSSIILYSRPFSSNERKETRAAKRIGDCVLDHLSEEDRELHRRVLQLRNKAIAHAEWTFHPTAVTREGIIQSRPFSIWTHFQTVAEVSRFSALVTKVLQRSHHLSADMLPQLSNSPPHAGEGSASTLSGSGPPDG